MWLFSPWNPKFLVGRGHTSCNVWFWVGPNYLNKGIEAVEITDDDVFFPHEKVYA